MQSETAQAADKSAPSGFDQERRGAALRRSFQRELGHRPTMLQSTLMQRAAVLTARAEAAALDLRAKPNDVVRLDGAAHRARAAMFEAFATKREPKRENALPSLAALIAEAHHG